MIYIYTYYVVGVHLKVLLTCQHLCLNPVSVGTCAKVVSRFHGLKGERFQSAGCGSASYEQRELALESLVECGPRVA